MARGLIEAPCDWLWQFDSNRGKPAGGHGARPVTAWVFGKLLVTQPGGPGPWVPVGPGRPGQAAASLSSILPRDAKTETVAAVMVKGPLGPPVIVKSGAGPGTVRIPPFLVFIRAGQQCK